MCPEYDNMRSGLCELQELLGGLMVLMQAGSDRRGAESRVQFTICTHFARASIARCKPFCSLQVHSQFATRISIAFGYSRTGGSVRSAIAICTVYISRLQRHPQLWTCGSAFCSVI